MTELLTGLAIGFFGSFHCVGMCGPIALILPVAGKTFAIRLLSRILYNIGRIITYSALGFLFGLLGSRFVISGFQQYMSIAIGIIILIYLLLPRKIKTKIIQFGFVLQFNAKIKNSLGYFIKSKSVFSLFVIGLINGLLPCGFVYMGLSGAIALGEPHNSMLFMTFFGLGTFPAMLITSMAGNKINLSLRKKINKIIPYLAALMAVLFILRGLNLGIPYVSPKLKTVQPAERYCQ